MFLELMVKGMWYALVQIFDFLNTYFRPILLITGTGFGIYFSLQKVGTKIAAEYKVSKSRFCAQHISNIVLSNKKDKTISIWSIHAVFDKDFKLELDKFDPPKILKAYETVSLLLPKYSSLGINGDNFIPDYFRGNVSLYIDTGDKFIKCKEEIKKDFLNFYTPINRNSYKFNGHVFDESVAFILNYFYSDKSYTAFICKSGFIGNEWQFGLNHLGDNEITEITIEWFVKQYGFDKLFTNYLCFKVNYPETTLAFKKELEIST